MTERSLICLNCNNYSNHTTGGCPAKKCVLCGKTGHLKKDCLRPSRIERADHKFEPVYAPKNLRSLYNDWYN